MQVVLLERIHRLGQMGDVVKVKDGFARNFLLPRKKALRATKANLERFQTERAQLEARNLAMKSEAEKVATKLDKQSFVLVRQAGEAGQLYGSVAARDVSDAVSAGGITIQKSQVAIDRGIKNLGLHQVRVILHPEVSVGITINVARSPEEADRQARGENVLLTDREQEAAEARADAEALFESEEAAKTALGGEDEGGGTEEAPEPKKKKPKA